MRSRILHIAFFLFTLSACQQPASPVDLAKESVTFYDDDGIKTHTKYFHPNGELKQEVFYEENGSIGNRVTYDYDLTFNLVEKFDSVKQTRETYFYDDLNRQIKEIKEDFSGRQLITSSYSEDGLMRIDSIQKSDHVTITHYDERGNEVEVYLLDVNRDTVWYSQTSYNEENLEIKNEYWNGGLMVRNRERIYNTANDITEENWYNASGVLRMNYIYEYDKDGRLLKTSRFTDGEEDFRLEYSYKDNERICTTYIPRVRTKTSKEVYTYHSSP